MEKAYHCIILSTKSAGSSALQKYLVNNYGFRMTDKTMHHENETLFWTKAASVLNLPQLKMHKSNVPYSPGEAIKSLNTFCKNNKVKVINEGVGVNMKAKIFEAYKSLILQNKLRFVEKSPHHLFNESNLDLIQELISTYKDEIDFKVIGLVRHPLSVIYSGWNRWKYNCSHFEKEWRTSNENLLKYKESLNIDIVCYEDLVEKDSAFMEERLAISPIRNSFRFRTSSLNKWREDINFGHKLEEDTIRLAKKFGYTDFETASEPLMWKIKYLSTIFSADIKRMISSLVNFPTIKEKPQAIPDEIIINQTLTSSTVNVENTVFNSQQIV